MLLQILYVLEDWIYLYYLNKFYSSILFFLFLRIEFICIIWTLDTSIWHVLVFLRIEFICIIWTYKKRNWKKGAFLRIEFICIIWTLVYDVEKEVRSWGLNLFVLFELWQQMEVSLRVLEDWIYLYYLNSAYVKMTQTLVLEDWIYLYYLILFIWCYINYHILTYTLFSYRKTPTNKAWANDFCVMFIRFFP